MGIFVYKGMYVEKYHICGKKLGCALYVGAHCTWVFTVISFCTSYLVVQSHKVGVPPEDKPVFLSPRHMNLENLQNKAAITTGEKVHRNSTQFCYGRN